MDQQLLQFLQQSNEIEDVFDDASLQQALLAWMYLTSCPVLGIREIETAHGMLMKDHLKWPEAGRMRYCDVWVGGQRCPKPMRVPALLQAWCEQRGLKELPKTEAEIDKAHVELMKIHPFVDGNGRLGRLVWQWHRQMAGLPIAIIAAAERGNYYQWFKI